MKVLMINSVSGYGSTGTICEEIAHTLEQQGHQCFIAYGQLTTTYQRSFKIGTTIENHFHNLGSRILGKQGYFTKEGTQKLIQFIQKIDPDVIHLHNLHGNYLNLPLLYEYLIKVQKPVVYTLHDCWPFTGKCSHYTDISCYKWQSVCSNCPQIHQYPSSVFFDFSKTMFLDKKRWTNSLGKLKIIAVSKWLESQAKKSFLQNYPMECIYNWVDSTVFKPYHSLEVLKEYGIDDSKFSVILVSAHWNRKDGKWHDLLQLSKSLNQDIQIIVIGNIKKSEELPENCISINYVSDRTKLAELYSFSDVYVHLSTEDTFGKVIAEAMSCGTPAIVYDSTACPEIVGEYCGYVVPKRNVSDVVKAIEVIRNETKQPYSEKCRDFVLKNFNMNSNINQTIAVYKSLLE